MGATSIKGLINQMMDKQLPEIVIGVVVKITPYLEIVLKDDPNIILHEVSLYIPGNRLPIEKGEELYMLALRTRKMYYILDRVGVWRPWRKSW